MHDGQPGALVTLLDIGVAEHDDRVAVLKELVGSERELVPRPNSLLKDRDGRVLTLVRPPTGHVFGIPALPREVLRPVRQRRLQVALRELLVALAQQAGLASHYGTPVAQRGGYPSHRRQQMNLALALVRIRQRSARIIWSMEEQPVLATAPARTHVAHVTRRRITPADVSAAPDPPYASTGVETSVRALASSTASATM